MNSIASLFSSSAPRLHGESISTISAAGESDTSFSDIFSDIYDLAESTETEDKGSVLSLLTGNVDDISSVMIDSEKAEIALSLTIEVRNKVLDAYNEIMNMQV